MLQHRAYNHIHRLFEPGNDKLLIANNGPIIEVALGNLLSNIKPIRLESTHKGLFMFNSITV
ncbi:hypothetical protein N476_24910 [Pseudoalteromonas luteoviolacea H33]|uniref:Uncharacterized protein n=1 Tax=Pseudoalteromonas luteoviolacea H33 TaxID=1365251 RepID=A0A162A3K4_9GAMM|nr:hypothetical protein N476_24910 [Pseudoalteromonas luteoviolacea H33]KZN76927.1 hypothetical protein N477_13790 [Pseudoalteromonas luteoviolacea H33-S]